MIVVLDLFEDVLSWFRLRGDAEFCFGDDVCLDFWRIRATYGLRFRRRGVIDVWVVLYSFIVLFLVIRC